MNDINYKNQKVEFPGEHLIKTFDANGRIIEIEYLLSGKKCQIEYAGDCWGSTNIKHITWSDGYVYMTSDELSNGTGPKKGWNLVERENPNNNYILCMDFDNNNKLIHIEKTYQGKIIFKRKIGDWGFDGRLRYNECYITMTHKKG